MIPTFKAIQKEGVLFIENPVSFKRYISGLKDKPLTVTVKAVRKHRSLDQNSYFHGVVLPILSQETGYTTDEMKDIVKTLFLRKTMTVAGQEIEVVLGSSDLNTKQFENFMEDIRRWASTELWCDIPEPNEMESE